MEKNNTMNRQLAFSLDLERCSGCFACVVACQDQNDTVAQAPPLRQVGRHENGAFPTRLSFISIACFHCGDAPCLMACPSGAMYRHADTGLVDINRDICVGCHSCELACPFGAPKFAADGKMVKCDMCAVRVAHEMAPACVHTCPTRALTFGEARELSQAKARQAGLRLLKAVGPQTTAR